MVAPYVKCACVIFGLVAPAGSHHHVWDRHLEVHAEDEYDHSEDGEDDRWIWFTIMIMIMIIMIVGCDQVDIVVLRQQTVDMCAALVYVDHLNVVI